MKSFADTVVNKTPFLKILYPVIAEPPSFAGNAHDTVARLSPPTTETPSGDSGTVAGVTEPNVPHAP